MAAMNNDSDHNTHARSNDGDHYAGDHYDAIVIGSGITGGWAAKELTEKGLRTLVLERGRDVSGVADYPWLHAKSWQVPYNFKPDRQAWQQDYPVQSRVYNFDATTKPFYNNDRLNPYAKQEQRQFDWIRGNQVGGRSLLWNRQSYRFSDLDFTANAIDGHGVDWPIRYADIEPWYRYVEEYIGVSGQAEGWAHLPDSVFQPPMDKFRLEHTIEARLKQQAPEVKTTIGRTATLTRDQNGRKACHYCGPCERGCMTRSQFSSQSVTLPAARATGRMTLRPNSVVTRLLHDPASNRVTAVEVIDANSKKRQRFTADLFFVCASAAASTQLLLNSHSPGMPKGLGNSSGALGHWFTDHTHANTTVGIYTDHLDRYYRGVRPNGLYIPRYQNLNNETNGEYLRGFGFQCNVRRMDWRYAYNMRGVGKFYKDMLRQPGPWLWIMTAFGEALPRFENQLSLDSQQDRFGVPLVKFNVQWSDNEQRMWQQMQAESQRIQRAAGAAQIVALQTELDPPGASIHEMGGAVMGRDRRHSVLNAHNQLHDVPNVFVTDGACMPSASCVNPSLTYMALTARACDYAVKQRQRGLL